MIRPPSWLPWCDVLDHAGVFCVALVYIYYYIDIFVNVKHYFTVIQEKL